MQSQSFSNPAGWTIVLTGLALSFVSAMTPFYEPGYLLEVDVLLAGLVPYLVYSVAVPMLRGAVTTSAGIILLAVHLGLVVSERFIDGADYSDGLIYTLPLLMALAVLPLAVVALLKTSTH